MPKRWEWKEGRVKCRLPVKDLGEVGGPITQRELSRDREQTWSQWPLPGKVQRQQTPPRVETLRAEGKGMQEDEGRLGEQLGVRGLRIGAQASRTDGQTVALGNQPNWVGWVGRRTLKGVKQLHCCQEHSKLIQDGSGGTCPGQSPQVGAGLGLKVTAFPRPKWRDKLVSGCWVEVKSKQWGWGQLCGKTAKVKHLH